jgi:hypothetical protein
MTEIATEDDLWKLFWKSPPKNGHRKKGEEFVFCDDLLQILDARSFGEDGKSKLDLNDENRRYLVASDEAHTFVRQRDLREVSKAMMREAGMVHVGYLGTA